MPGKMWDVIIYQFPNFNGCTAIVWEWISNFIPHFMMDVAIYPQSTLRLTRWGRVTNAGILLIRPLGINFNDNSITIARLGRVAPLGRARSVYKSNVECLFLCGNDSQMTSIFNTNREYPGVHVWCKFGDSSRNLWRVIAQTSHISHNSESKMAKMTLKVKVYDLHFQYQPRVSQDACLVLIWWF